MLMVKVFHRVDGKDLMHGLVEQKQQEQRVHQGEQQAFLQLVVSAKMSGWEMIPKASGQ